MDDADTPVKLSKQLNQVIITMTALLECLITFCKLSDPYRFTIACILLLS